MAASFFDQLFEFVDQAENVDSKDPPRTGAGLSASRVSLNFKKCQHRFTRATVVHGMKRGETFQDQFPVVLNHYQARKISPPIMQ